jgi:hypothetical protein
LFLQSCARRAPDIQTGFRAVQKGGFPDNRGPARTFITKETEMTRRARRATVSAVAILLPAVASAFEPVGADGFNVKSAVDLSTLTSATFEATLLPAAQAQGKIVFYDFTESFTPLFADNLIPAFEAAYPGIDVEYYSVNGEAAVQQLMAAKDANRKRFLAPTFPVFV